MKLLTSQSIKIKDELINFIKLIIIITLALIIYVLIKKFINCNLFNYYYYNFNYGHYIKPILKILFIVLLILLFIKF